jgi:hypothetical protein
MYASQADRHLPWSGRLPVFAEDPAHPNDARRRSTKLYQAFCLGRVVS